MASQGIITQQSLPILQEVIQLDSFLPWLMPPG